MSQRFNCPSCGAVLEYQGDEPAVRCAYCGNAVVVPEELRAHEPSPGQMQWTATPLTIDLRGLMGQVETLKEVKRLAREGRQAEAARFYQESTGSSAQHAEAAVQQLAAGRSVVLSSSTSMSIPVVSETQVQVVDGQEAAKLLREQIAGFQQQQRSNRRVGWMVLSVIAGIAVIAGCALVGIILLY